MDEETLKTDPDALGGSSLADFRALYSSMKAEDTTEIKRHVQTAQEEAVNGGAFVPFILTADRLDWVCCLFPYHSCVLASCRTFITCI